MVHLHRIHADELESLLGPSEEPDALEMEERIPMFKAVTATVLHCVCRFCKISSGLFCVFLVAMLMDYCVYHQRDAATAGIGAAMAQISIERERYCQDLRHGDRWPHRRIQNRLDNPDRVEWRILPQVADCLDGLAGSSLY